MFEALRGRCGAALLLPFLLGAQAPSAPAPEPAEAPPEPPAPLRRVQPPPSPYGHKLDLLGQRLGTHQVSVEDPCVVPGESPCTRTALAPFFSDLDALVTRTATVPTVISAFGNSLIAGDRIVDIVRQELGYTFGSGGRGLLLVDRMAPYGLRTRVGYASGEWEPRTLAEPRLSEYPFGVSGVHHRALKPWARSRFKLEGEPRATLWWLDAPRAGALSVRADGKEIARTEPGGGEQAVARTLAVDIPEGARTLDVVAEGRDAVVRGVVLQHPRPGIVLDTLGVTSADANLFLRAHEDIFRDELVQRDPRLLLFMLGGNEAKRIEWGRNDLDEVEEGLRALLRRSRAARPASACLVVGPIDAVRGGEGPQKLVQRPHLAEVIAVERKVALAEGCAFFDLFTAMGGTGSFARFLKAGLVHEDLVHPKGKGLDLLGQLITEALLRAWVDASPPGRQAALAPLLQVQEAAR